MQEFTPGFFAIAMPAVAFAALSKSGFGSGAGFVAVSILALVVPPEVALGILLPPLLVVDFASLPPYWKRWSWPDARLMMLGGIPGVLLGALFLEMADDNAIRLLIGVISLGFVIWQLGAARGWLRTRQTHFPLRAGFAAGVVAAFTSFVSHAGGPAAAIYLLGRKLDKTQYQATTVIVFWFVNIWKFVLYALLGVFSAQTLMADLYLLPAALFGTWLGIRAHWMIPQRAFFALTYVLLACTGSKLIWDALT